MMAGRTRSHSEERWQLLPETIVRCNGTRPNGGRCKREAEDGAVVCDQHGGAAPQVRRRAAERLIMTADQAAQMLVKMMEDTEVQPDLSTNSRVSLIGQTHRPHARLPPHHHVCQDH